MKALKEESESAVCATGADREQLVVRAVLEAAEVQWFDQTLAQKHYLGATPPIGDFLRQRVVVRRQGCGVVGVGTCALKLKDREQWIGWSVSQRGERLKLVVQNRRFLLLHAKGRNPNLASQAMAAALRALPGQWQERFGYRPLLAESFTDPEAYAGTCYKASNWEPVGMSDGYRRHRADFYVANDRPKRLWLSQLVRRPASDCAPRNSRKTVAAGGGRPSGTLPVNAGQMSSLSDVFRKAPDPRGSNARYRIGPVLTLIAMALLAGRREIAEIARFATTLTQPQRRRLALPIKKGTRRFHEVPAYGVFYQVLTRMDPEAFAALLNGWLSSRAGALPQALWPGRQNDPRPSSALLTLAQHEDGAPQAVADYRSEGRHRTLRTSAARH